MTTPSDDETDEDLDTRTEVARKIGKKLFELVRPEAIALGGALVDRGVRAVMDGDLKIRVGAGPAPGTRRKRRGPQPAPPPQSPSPAQESKPQAESAEDPTIIEADFVVSEPDEPVDETKVETGAKASTIAVEPEPAPKSKRRVLPSATGSILGKKMRYRCTHCSGTWSEIRKVEKCPRCFEPDWQDGEPEEL